MDILEMWALNSGYDLNMSDLFAKYVSLLPLWNESCNGAGQTIENKQRQ